ncbi:MAG TPA: energy coupling factor transporter S component ThiW [Ruminococcaceae bacterium]|nr:energy coupling factor transporter S component ThiW [Oscillospiraceae bacterium]
MPRGENDAAESRGSARSSVISVLQIKSYKTLLRWEAVFRRERRPKSLDREIFQRSNFNMKKNQVKKLALAGMFCAIAVVGSLFSFPVFGSKCAPIQHMVNILCAVLLGPWYGLGVAFAASLIRNLLGLGSLMAFPGSMFGALLCGLVYKKTKNLPLTLVGEVGGTSVLGGLCAYPVAVLLMGKSASDIAFYAYIFPFFISTAAGAIISGILVFTLKKCGVLSKMQNGLK